MKTILYLLIAFSFHTMEAQTQDFFRQIPEAPTEYTAASVVTRMVDGLGYRYYWATEQLAAADLEYQTSSDGRTIRETLDHVYSLSEMIRSTATGEVFNRKTGAADLDWQALRAKTLENFKRSHFQFIEASDLASLQIDFGSGSTLPLWNAINGPIEDAVWHTGQVVMMRRAAGNPMPAGVNVLMGKTKEQ
ncbi:MAG: putative damage-inducible protein DinB [Cyclobacteriaceae bacterium]|jgi:uncharacterized damage-inducible protein DinB